MGSTGDFKFSMVVPMRSRGEFIIDFLSDLCIVEKYDNQGSDQNAIKITYLSTRNVLTGGNEIILGSTKQCLVETRDGYCYVFSIWLLLVMLRSLALVTRCKSNFRCYSS